MTDFNSIKSPVEVDLLISFFDLTNFIKISDERKASELFELLSGFYELAGCVIEAAGGKVIKFIGDAGLAVFAEDKIDAGIRALMELQKKTEIFFARRNVSTRLIVKTHFGSAALGPLGASSEKRLDVIGESVNTAATLASKGFAISPQAFRKLSAETRKYFRKHTPPVVYILSD
ncbi:MAG TPA: adenylate/guanylate cyclase domain-containing protein [Candidatus Wallbacteria bacterium]|nr:adenylate/guanylate cyclase domain-containing protein [Candidatus Wallbacteria bacterium]